MGELFGCMFFVSVLFAGLTSLMNMFEVCSEAAQTHIKLKRNHAVFIVGLIVFVVGLFIEYEPYMGKWMDIITIYIVPIGAVLCSTMIYWVLGTKKIGDELAIGAKKHVGNIFCFTAKYIYVFLAAAVVVLSFVYKGIG